MSIIQSILNCFKPKPIRLRYPIVDSSAAVAKIVEQVTYLSTTTGILMEDILVISTSASCLHQLISEYDCIHILLKQGDIDKLKEAYPNVERVDTKIKFSMEIPNTDLTISSFRGEWVIEDGLNPELTTTQVEGITTLDFKSLLKQITTTMENIYGHIYGLVWLHKTYPFLITKRSRELLEHMRYFI